MVAVEGGRAPLKAVGGSVVITPEWPVVMGCGETADAVGAVHDDVECNVLVLRDGSSCLVIASIDALYVGPTVRTYLEDRFHEEIAPEQIFLAASHAHSAPQLDPTKPMLGMPDDGHVARVCELIGDLITRLLSEPGEGVQIEATRYRSTVMVNRRKRRLVSGAERRLRFSAVTMAPNPGATGTQYGHLIALVGANGPIGYLWQLPCHPTSVPSGRGVTAGYPGVGRAALRDGSGVPVVFLQGFSGDLRPPAVHSPVGWQGWARRVALGVEFTAFTDDEFDRWCETVVSELAQARRDSRSIANRAAGPMLDARRVLAPLADYHEDSGVGRVMSVHSVSIGEVMLLGVSAEPVSAYAEELMRRPEAFVIPVGCVDDVVGYAPTTRVLREGGYEGGRFARHFNVGSPRQQYEPRLRTQFDQVLASPVSEVRS